MVYYCSTRVRTYVREYTSSTRVHVCTTRVAIYPGNECPYHTGMVLQYQGVIQYTIYIVLEYHPLLPFYLSAYIFTKTKLSSYKSAAGRRKAQWICSCTTLHACMVRPRFARRFAQRGAARLGLASLSWVRPLRKLFSILRYTMHGTRVLLE